VTWLQPLFVALTVFGVGVTAIDLLGFLGGDDETGGNDEAGADAELDVETDGGGETGADSGGDDADTEDSDDEVSVAGHDRRRRNPLLVLLSSIRSFVYFSLGFGPTGLFATFTGQPVLATLLWSGGVGLVTFGGALVLRRVMRSELSSDVKDSDLLMETGEVTVRVDPGQLGKVRVSLGGSYVDRYAKTHSQEPIGVGTRIRVTDLGEDCIFVEPAEE
jgi:membrane protein implicated in regulation of membrane protease activity